MSSCLSGGGRAYRLESLDLEIIKSPSTSSWISNSSNSPSSTLSESSNSPLAISTRKPRTPRKRPNQTYNEAAALLSTAYPKIFPTKHLLRRPPCKSTKSHDNNYKNPYPFLFEPSDDLLMPFQVIDHNPHRPNLTIETKGSNPCRSPGEINSNEVYQEDFDTESILDEEIGDQGIDSILGNLSTENESTDDSSASNMQMNNACCYGYPVGLGFEYGYGMRREFRAMRHVDEGDWWRFPCVNVLDITPTPTIDKIPAEKKKKKKKKKAENNNSEPAGENSIASPKLSPVEPSPNAGLLLKLNYDTVLNAWSDKGSPFSGDAQGSESAGNDVQV
ncbi:hypothetical protein CDL12_11076 [Handroanthus impetiginosus]|uniref:Protein CHLOROPLAST IMPORT APPARATUS 2-like n=1 Tax=Handroanthus impetiginosus TaxID=429701 RepID=A0A2G9HFR2_9LAMI|nr:hypothetical protein CDL12_11076 [Handroanthus impetiginosus]